MTLFLDLDGPILDVRQRYYAVHRALLGEEPAARLDLETFWHLKRSRASHAVVLERCGVDPAAVGAYSKGWKERIESAEFLPLDQVFEGVDGLLRNWMTHHALVVVTLRQRPELVRGQLLALGILGCFRDVLTADPTAGHGWEAKARLIREHPLYEPSACVIGDTEMDIRAGKLTGLRTAGVLSGIRSRELLAAEKPDVILEGLPDAARWIAGRE